MSTKLTIVHLSDIHFREKDSDNPLTSKADQLCSAIKSRIVSGNAPVWVVFSGDIAFSGLREEYTFAKSLVQKIRSRIQSETLFIISPGNHDCNFKQDNGARRAIIATTLEEDVDRSVVDVTTSIQSAFFEFQREFGAPLRQVKNHDKRMIASHILHVEDVSIEFYAINSAWISQKEEIQGKVILPPGIIDLPRKERPTVRVAVLHHPSVWFDSENARRIRKLMMSSFDIVISGHEHDGDVHRSSTPTGQDTTFLEGGVLQAHNSPLYSTFYIYQVDISTSKSLLTGEKFRWNADTQIYTAETQIGPFQLGERFGENNSLQFNEKHRLFLNDLGAAHLTSSSTSAVLDDLFVMPDFHRLDADTDTSNFTLVRGTSLFGVIETNKKLYICADEKSGRTALAKQIVKNLYKNGVVVIYASAQELARIPKASKWLENLFSEQYRAPSIEEFRQLPVAKRALVMDGAEMLTREQRYQFFSEASSLVEHVVILATQNTHMEDFMEASRRHAALDNFAVLEVLPFGHVKRSELVEKWLQQPKIIDQIQGRKERPRNVQELLERQVSEILGHNLVPSYPLYILLILQQLEARQPGDSMPGSLGYLYEALITRGLTDVLPPKELDSHWNYLTELGGYFFFASILIGQIDTLEVWHKEYCERFAVDLDFSKTLKRLEGAYILRTQEDSVVFRHKYHYCYFAARYLKDRLNEPSILQAVQNLGRRLHDELSADIFLFLCHQTKDPRVIDGLLESSRLLLSKYSMFKFEEADARFREIFVRRDVELPSTAPRENRLNALAERDVATPPSASSSHWEMERESLVPNESIEVDDDEIALDDIMQSNAAFRMVRILGQTLRNFSGSLTAERKLELTRECYSLGLRALEYFVCCIMESGDIFIEAILQVIKKRPDHLTQFEKDQLVSRAMYGLLEAFAYSVIRHVAESVGDDSLRRTYQHLIAIAKEGDAQPHVGSRLITILINLEHASKFPKNEVLSLSNNTSVRKSVFSSSLLRRIVWHHFYLFETNFQVRQEVCKKIGIRETAAMLPSRSGSVQKIAPRKR